MLAFVLMETSCTFDREVAALINADPKEIVWTSGATESDNLAIKGAARFHKDKGKHLITVKTEHKAVLDSMRELEREGFEVTYMDVGKDGLLDLDALAKAMRPDTTLVSVMAVNNEIGVIQDIEKIGEMCRERGILFHVDATQAAGKIPLDMEKLKVDLMSLSKVCREERRYASFPRPFPGGTVCRLRPYRRSGVWRVCLSACLFRDRRRE